MKIKIPSKTVEACDLCRRETVCLNKCVVCGRDYCHTCEAIIMGCVHRVNACKECADDCVSTGEKIRALVRDFATPLDALLKKRDKALGAIPKPAYAKIK